MKYSLPPFEKFLDVSLEEEINTFNRKGRLTEEIILAKVPCWPISGLAGVIRHPLPGILGRRGLAPVSWISFTER